MRNQTYAFALLTAVMLFSPIDGMATIYHVKTNGNDANNGTSWPTAFETLQKALDVAVSGDQIWVAAGTYLPTKESSSGEPRTKTFAMKNEVAIYGGFPNSGSPTFGQRDWTTNVTTLSGNIGDPNTSSDNSYHVIFNNNLTVSAVLDGFTITEGYANELGMDSGGGGMRNISSAPTVTNCRFIENTAQMVGGGIYNDNSSPIVTNCTFVKNASQSGHAAGMYNLESSPMVTSCGFIENSGGGMANVDASPMVDSCSFTGNDASYGGGMENAGGAPVVTNCLFTGNTAKFSFSEGGAIYSLDAANTVSNCIFANNLTDGLGGSAAFRGGSTTMANCLFYGNSAKSDGGAIYNGLAFFTKPSSLTIINCTFSGNSSKEGTGGAVFNASSPFPITNSIFWENGDEVGYTTGKAPNITYSIVQGSYMGTGNLDADPVFMNAANGDFKLYPCSPAINTGTTTGAPTDDLNGNHRPFGSSEVDMGAHEYQGMPPTGNLIFVDVNATGDNDGSSWGNAYNDLQTAIDVAFVCGCEVWVAAGTYKPTATTDRSISFVMKNGVKIYGGLAGTETPGYDMSLRDFATNETVLSGDIGIPNNNSDNSYHVIYNYENGLNETAVLDGFTVLGGNANEFLTYGGGMFNKESSPIIANCTFSNNNSERGGGMYNDAASPILRKCIFYGNSAEDGGGLYNWNAPSPRIENCSFFSNTATSGDFGLGNNFGGAMVNYSSSPTIINCTFNGNSASTVGGCMANVSSSPMLTNCILWGNGTELYNENSTPNVTYSIVQGSFSGMGNLNADPLFVDAVNGDLRLSKCSPAIDVGSNTAIPVGITTDLDGNDRILNATGIPTASVDMGAYEHTGTRTIAKCRPHALQLDVDGTATLAAQDIYDADAADCTPTSLLADNTDFSCTDVGMNTVELTVSIAGFVEQGTCTATVTVEDNVKPDAKCKPHTVQLNANGNGSITASDIDDNSSDVCGIASLSAAPNTFGCSNVGANTVTLTVTDNNGNPNTCTATVTVEDKVKPIAKCKDLTLQLDANSGASLLPSDINNGSTDACGIASLQIDLNKFGCENRGENTVTLSVMDANGNESTCTSTITIEDDLYPCCPPTHVIYVNENTPNDNDGSDWDNAFASLQRALEQASRCPIATEVWVATGTYFPDDSPHHTKGNRIHSFKMQNGLAILGGFTGNETDKAQRDFTTNTCTLSGDIGTPNVKADNSYHVVKNGSGIGPSAVLDGFTVSSGHADHLLYNTAGAGMLNEGASPTIRSCTFSINTSLSRGGGMCNTNASPTLLNCSFLSNSAADGGAMANVGGSAPSVDSCFFSENNAPGNGGAIYNNAASPTFSNCQLEGNQANGSGGALAGVAASAGSFVACSFAGNTAGDFGGAVYCSGGSTTSAINSVFIANSSGFGGGLYAATSAAPVLTNCTFHANSATHGGAIANQSASPVLANCILWGNGSKEIENYTTTTQATFSIVKMASGTYPGTGNLNVNPLFAGSTDLRIRPCSPAVDVGNNAANATTLDILGNARFMGNIDMGAYENPVDLNLPCTFNGLGDGTSWTDGSNWTDGFVPGGCRDVVIPTGFDVTIPAGLEGHGKMIEVETGATLETLPTATMDIGN